MQGQQPGQSSVPIESTQNNVMELNIEERSVIIA